MIAGRGRKGLLFVAASDVRLRKCACQAFDPRPARSRSHLPLLLRLIINPLENPQLVCQPTAHGLSHLLAFKWGFRIMHCLRKASLERKLRLFTVMVRRELE